MVVNFTEVVVDDAGVHVEAAVIVVGLTGVGYQDLEDLTS